MGRDTRMLHYEGLVSRHNSRQDRIDDLLWEEFVDTMERARKAFLDKYPFFNVECTRADNIPEGVDPG